MDSAVVSLGNFGAFGDALPTAKQFVSGLGLSMATGGIIQGVNASLHGRSFLTGKLPMPEVRPMPALPFTTPEAKLNTDGMRTQLKDMPSSVERGSGSTLSLPKPEMNEVNFVTRGAAVANEGGKELYNFGATAAKHMTEPGRRVPLQIMDDVLKSTKGLPDPGGSRALMYNSPMWRNGKLYNLEILYDKTSNSIWHFQYNSIKP